jgi:hypothetical protein
VDAENDLIDTVVILNGYLDGDFSKDKGEREGKQLFIGNVEGIGWFGDGKRRECVVHNHCGNIGAGVSFVVGNGE